jgi:hypothetical protein
MMGRRRWEMGDGRWEMGNREKGKWKREGVTVR